MNTIETLFVPYELAVKLKELGFDEPCFAFYKNQFLQRSFVQTFEECKNSTFDSITAPLYQQAFRWFREKHDLQSACIMFPNGKYGNAIVISKATQFLETYMPIYDTYEKAELACLIKLIEIVKEDKQ